MADNQIIYDNINGVNWEKFSSKALFCPYSYGVARLLNRKGRQLDYLKEWFKNPKTTKYKLIWNETKDQLLDIILL